MKQFTQQEASDFYDSKQWESWPALTIAKFQMNQEFLCIPWKVVTKSVNEVLGREVEPQEWSWFPEKIKEQINNIK